MLRVGNAQQQLLLQQQQQLAARHGGASRAGTPRLIALGVAQSAAVNNKTAAESFPQNQPVTARGISHKNLQRTTAPHRGRLGQRSQEWQSVVQP